MERTKEEVNSLGEKKVEFRKIGGGSFRMANGKIIKPGQVFKAYPSQIPEGFRDSLIPLEDLPPSPAEKKLDLPPSEYRMVKREGSNWWDVFGPGDKKMNEKALTQAKALEHIKGLEE